MADTEGPVKRLKFYDAPAEFDYDALKAYELCRIYVEWRNLKKGNTECQNDIESHCSRIDHDRAREILRALHGECEGNQAVLDLRTAAYRNTGNQKPGQVWQRVDASKLSLLTIQENYARQLLSIAIFHSFAIRQGDQRGSISLDLCTKYMSEIRSFFGIQRIREALVQSPIPSLEDFLDTGMTSVRSANSEDSGYEVVAFGRKNESRVLDDRSRNFCC